MKTHFVPRIATLMLVGICLSACSPQDAPISSAVAGSAPAAVAAPAPPVAVCNTCGTVRSVTELKQDGRASGAGAVIGGIVGGVAGNQVGGGSGRTVATAAGVIGGALLGNEVEQNRNASTSYEIVVDMEGGGQRVLTISDAAGIYAGTKVNVQGANISLR